MRRRGRLLDLYLAVLLGIDVLSALLAASAAIFFARARSLMPGRGFGILALAFALMVPSFLLVTATTYAFIPLQPAGLAFRGVGLLLSTFLLLLQYGGRRAGWRPETVRRAAVALVATFALYVLAYLALPGQLPDPSSGYALLRFVDAACLIAVALLVTLEVHARTLADFRVPLGFILLAFGRYTIAVVTIADATHVIGLAYLWRVAGLLVLASIALPSLRWSPDKA